MPSHFRVTNSHEKFNELSGIKKCIDGPKGKKKKKKRGYVWDFDLTKWDKLQGRLQGRKPALFW